MRSRVSRTVPAIAVALLGPVVLGPVVLGTAVPAGAVTRVRAADPALAAATAPVSAVPYSWHNARIVAGGFVDGLVFSDAQRGLAYARTDVGGAYRWDAAAKNWVPLLDFTGFNAWNELGVESIAADPHDAGKVWLATGEYTQPWASPPDGEILLPAGTGAEQTASLPQRHAVPGRGGDLWLTGGDGLLYHRTDGGKAFAPDATVDTVATLGFGRAAAGARYPAIYLAGVIGGVQGIFRSTDGGAHWARINAGAQQWGWTGQAITGDPDVFGRVYLPTNGRGIQYGDPAVSR